MAMMSWLNLLITVRRSDGCIGFESVCLILQRSVAGLLFLSLIFESDFLSFAILFRANDFAVQ